MKKLIVLGVIIMNFLFCGKSEIDKVLNIPENFQPTYTVAEVEDVSYPAAVRKTIRITVPKGMSDADVTLNMKSAVKRYYEQYKADAISIFAYFEGTNTKYQYTAGMCEFAPGGDWGSAKKGTPVSQFGVKIDIVKPKPKPKKAEIAATAKEYNVDLKVKKLSARKIKIDIDTNFPDGTIFVLTVGRPYDSDYLGDILDVKPAVKSGKIALTVDVNDKKWYGEYMQKQKTMGKELFSDIKKIENHIRIWVMYTPRQKHPKDVLSVLGKNGEFVKGDGAKVSGKFVTFEKEMKVNIPFKK